MELCCVTRLLVGNVCSQQAVADILLVGWSWRVKEEEEEQC
jgi:hypothetical protein